MSEKVVQLSESLLTADTSQKEEPEEKAQSPTKGVMAVLVGTLCLALSRLGIKHLYESQPDLSAVQLMTYQAIVAFAFNILWLNVSLKKEMCTSVKKELIG